MAVGAIFGKPGTEDQVRTRQKDDRREADERLDKRRAQGLERAAERRRIKADARAGLAARDTSARSRAETTRINRPRQSPREILDLINGGGTAGGGGGAIPGSATAAIASGRGGAGVPNAADTAFSREKDRVGNVAQSALSGLSETLNARGIRGPAAGAQIGGVFKEGVSQLGEFSRDQVLEASQRQEREQEQGRELASARRAQSIQALLGILQQQEGLF